MPPHELCAIVGDLVRNFQATPDMVHFNGQLLSSNFDNNVVMSDKIRVLFDTGALCANYISKRIFKKIREQLENKRIIKKNLKIGLADNKTRLESDTTIQLDMKISSEQQDIIYSGDFVVLEMLQNEVIIGMPAILGELWQFFKSEVEAVRTENMHLPELQTLHVSDVEQYLQPWSFSSAEEASEEKDNPLPTSFGDVSLFLGKSREDAISEFISMFEDHIDPEFRKSTKVEELLRGKGVNAFVPEKWTGMKGIEPLDIKFREDLPHRLKPKARPINPRLYEATEQEFMRLRGYIYVKSSSPWASCLTVAPKATKPFIRLCGDYRIINKYMEIPHYYIPNVRHQLDRIIEYEIFLDIDLTNAFHQIPVTEQTSAKLSIQTPWGQFQPLYVPEGIGPGSGKLQQTIMELFGDFDWAICLFDNVLILAKDYDDAYRKLDLFLDRCIEHSVVLKFAKTWLGKREVHFFGYNCRHHSYELTNDRKEAILKIPFPESGNRQKKVRSMLGMGVFFAPFVENYKDKVKHLTDLTKQDFNWDETTWKIDYRQEWEDYKTGLQEACSVFYPDYELEWFLRTDASEFGIGAVLFQVKRLENGEVVYQVIAMCSKKFSPEAMRWSTIEQEGYAIFYAVRHFAYYLIGKHFIVQTDHNNLRWMEASEVPKIVRWRVYLQSFDFVVQHISGRENTVADALSRLFMISMDDSDHDRTMGEEDSDDDWTFHALMNVFDLTDISETAPEPVSRLRAQELMEEVHNAQSGHWGAKEMWNRLNKLCPGHQIPYKEIADFVSSCACCEKTRRERKNRLIKIPRTLKPPHARSVIGIDAVKITPAGKNGESHILVIVNLFSKHAFLRAIIGVTAKNLAASVWIYWSNFGHTDMIISDLGTDLTSKLFAELVQLMGMRHVFSIADKHANGTERPIKEVVRHLRALVFDTRIQDIFDDVTKIPSVQYILNDHVSSETGFTPFELVFGSVDAVYKDLLKDCEGEPSHMLLKQLNENLTVLREASKKFQDQLVEERASQARLMPQNMYAPGDFVLFDAGPKPHPKLACRHKGPMQVVHQYKNDVDCRNLISGAIKKFSVEDLELFYGSAEEAFNAAMRDQEQFMVDKILGYKGDCRKRTSMTFKVKYADGEVLDIPYTPDILCEAYYDFCQSKPFLFHLSLDTDMATRFIRDKRKENITSVSPGDTVYVDLRFFGDLFYESLQLPDWETSSYVVPFTYLRWYHKGGSRKKITVRFDLNKQLYGFDNYMVYAWGRQWEFDESSMILVDDTITKHHPEILAVDGPTQE